MGMLKCFVDIALATGLYSAYSDCAGVAGVIDKFVVGNIIFQLGTILALGVTIQGLLNLTKYIADWLRNIHW